MTASPTSNLESRLPLSPVAFEILIALAEEDHHGYAILRAVETRTGRRLHAGSLYRALARLVREELIDELDERPDPETDERRRYYRITALGRALASAEARRLQGQLGRARATGLLEDGGAA